MKLREMWIRWMPVVVVAGVIAVLVAILAPAIQQARNAAHKSHSKNNLKQLGIALHNYHEANNCFPVGGLIDENNVAFHGWYTKITPFIDASPFYDRVNFAYPWADPENAHLFRLEHPAVLMPGAENTLTSDGFGLIHYQGNPNVFHRNHSVKLEDMTAGPTHTWFLGEVAGNYRPWGDAFNWRPLGTRLNAGPDSYGRPTEDGAFFLMGDGSVREVRNDVEPELLHTMANAPPIAPKKATEVPDRRFEYASKQPWTKRSLELEKFEDGKLTAAAHYDPRGTLRTVLLGFSGYEKDYKPNREVNVGDLKRIVVEYPQMQELLGAPDINNEAALVLSGLKHLTFLKARSVDVSEAGLSALKKLPRLRVLRAEMSDEMRKQLAEALPECEVQFAMDDHWY